jgi:hypothetical protein
VPWFRRSVAGHLPRRPVFDPGGQSGTKKFLPQYFCFPPVSTIPPLLHIFILILLLSKGQAWKLSSKATPFRYRGALATKLMSLLSLQLFWLHRATPAWNIITVYARVQATCHSASFARFCCSILKTITLTSKLHWP